MQEHRPQVADEQVRFQIATHLQAIYPSLDPQAWAETIIQALNIDPDRCLRPPINKWDESDIVLITYGDSLKRDGEAPLATLRQFVAAHLSDSVNTLHVLPFFPYSSDDGFAVINYLQVNDALGDWEDIVSLGREFKLMADLVINHVSSRSSWFSDFKQGRAPAKDYFLALPADTDVSHVVRPRPAPLLQPFQTSAGRQWVWCTFGPDQVDLNFANPEVLVEFVGIMAKYLEAGIRILRLDAVAFLWKRLGTECIHLDETHEIVKLLRFLAECKCPDAVVITETNVPNRQNLTYFGNGNEAHAIYNFSLPPLLVHTLLTGNCKHLKTWMMSMPPARAGTFYLNFIASHDGIGLRPAEGLLEPTEIDHLLESIVSQGGHISMRSTEDGSSRPYEANISLWNALRGSADMADDGYHLDRFTCAHAIMFGLEGIPAIYIHSFLGTENDADAVTRSGRYRTINRHVYDADELEAMLLDADSQPAEVLSRMRAMLRVRRSQPAFHPNAVQFTMHLGLSIFAFWRQSIDRSQSIFCISNVTAQPQEIGLSDVNLIESDSWKDLLTGLWLKDLRGSLTLAPYQTVWLSNHDHEVSR